ncbi:MAG: hypothetical protein QOJ16_4942, partial [Acidobacteriota bacterium]|nr:hypothetical protein [Acidobacteriota bacterium]
MGLDITTRRPGQRPVRSLVDLLRERAAAQGEDLAYAFLADGEVAARLTYAELDARARAWGAVLAEAGVQGERACLLFPPGLDFVAAFLGCLYAGAVAVPAPPPRRRRADPRLQAILADARPRVVLTSEGGLATLAGAIAGTPDGAALRGLTPPPVELAASWRELSPDPESVAFLQYTSGSTSIPKGVRVSHGNLLDNEERIGLAFEQSPSSVVLGWLPLYHDMGLIGNVLQPLWAGAP